MLLSLQNVHLVLCIEVSPLKLFYYGIDVLNKELGVEAEVGLEGLAFDYVNKLAFKLAVLNQDLGHLAQRRYTNVPVHDADVDHSSYGKKNLDRLWLCN